MEKTSSRRKAGGVVSRFPAQIQAAIKAAQDKKASETVVLDLRKSGAFTDYFVICSGQNVRQVKAIVDAIEEALLKLGVKPAPVEGYDTAGWVLLDFFDFIVHVFTPEMRVFYALERLWGNTEPIAIPDEMPRAESPTKKKASAPVSAT
jgi:ribosome-associated protein